MAGTRWNAGQYLAVQRRQAVHTCEQCQREFTGVLRARFCCSACRGKAWRSSKDEQGEEAETPSPYPVCQTTPGQL